jgi:hypothetical protein
LLFDLAAGLAVLGDTQGGDAGGADGDDGRSPPVGPAVGVGDDHGDPGARAGDQGVAEGAGGGVRVAGQQPGSVLAVAVDAGGSELVAEPVPGDDRAVISGQEIPGRVVQDELDELGAFPCPDGQVERFGARSDPGQADVAVLDDGDYLRGHHDDIPVLKAGLLLF